MQRFSSLRYQLQFFPGLRSPATIAPTPGFFRFRRMFLLAVRQADKTRFPTLRPALNAALVPDVALVVDGSFCTAGTCGGSEFFGTDLARNFEINPSTVGGSNSFEFTEIPPGTQFISIKQANGFQIFSVPGPTPFVLTHKLGGNSTSHISTYVPEPTGMTLLMVLIALGTGLRRRQVV